MPDIMIKRWFAAWTRPSSMLCEYLYLFLLRAYSRGCCVLLLGNSTPYRSPAALACLGFYYGVYTPYGVIIRHGRVAPKQPTHIWPAKRLVNSCASNVFPAPARGRLVTSAACWGIRLESRLALASEPLAPLPLANLSPEIAAGTRCVSRFSLSAPA